MPEVITNNLDLWTSALLTKSTAGRGSNGKLEAYGIKKLRELILELAVRGKLVPQDPNDELASVLLERVLNENAQLPSKRGRKSSDNLKITDGDISFELPQGWEYVRNGSLFTLRKGKKPKNISESPIGLPYLDIEALDRGNVLRFTDDDTCPRATEKDILVVCDGSRSGLVLDGKSGVIGSTLAVIDTPRMIQSFVKLIFMESYERLNSTMKGAAIPHLDTNRLLLEIVGLPPLNEQHRILAKVDELMVLCDQLEQQQTHSIAAHQTLVETLLGTLTRVESQQEFSTAWACIASHFDTLFTTEASIDQLKQTILQLAVMGKLVPQDHNDEPASVLLVKVTEAKERLISEGIIKRQKPLPEISEEEKEFELPTNWEWCRLQEITRLITDGKHGDCNNLSNSGFYFLSAKDIQNGELLYENARQIVPSEFEEVHQRTNLQPGDICMVNTGATVGKMAIATDNKLTYRTTFQKSVAVIKVATPLVDLRYIGNYLQAETPKLLHKSGGSAINNLLLGDLKKKLVPLPPINEQIKIVAKVDELMALCDTLKARITDAQTIQLHLADAVVERMII